MYVWPRTVVKNRQCLQCVLYVNILYKLDRYAMVRWLAWAHRAQHCRMGMGTVIKLPVWNVACRATPGPSRAALQKKKEKKSAAWRGAARPGMMGH